MIISASRRTDIPACFAPWFMHRLREAQVLVRNPYNPTRASRVSLHPSVVDCIVFFSKNFGPLLEYLPEVRALGHTCAFQYTLNAYGSPLEPRLPSLATRMDDFLRLAQWARTSHALTWRYDPIILDAKHGVQWHVDAFAALCGRLHGHVHRCVFSFVDDYAHLPRHRAASFARQDASEQWRLAALLAQVATEHALSLQTCAEAVDLESFGIKHGACLDAAQLSRVVGEPLRIAPGTGQRDLCRCVRCVDVGAYNTCAQACVYCYATSNAAVVREHAAIHHHEDAALGGPLPENVCITPREETSCKGRPHFEQGNLLKL